MARHFDGVVSQQDLNYSGAVVSSMPLTMAVWFRNGGALGSLFSISDADGLDFYRLYYDTGEVLKLRHTDGSTNGDALTTATYTDGVWSHAAAVFASTTSRSVYLDGGNKVSDTTSVNAVTDPDTTALSQLYYNSTIIAPSLSDYAEWGLWNVALTDAEIAILGLGYSPLFVRPASLVAYWPIIGRLSPEIDRVGGYDLTLVNGPTWAAHPRVILPEQKVIGPPLPAVDVAANINISPSQSYVQIV